MGGLFGGANSVYGDAERQALQRMSQASSAGMQTLPGQQQELADIMKQQALGQGGPAQQVLNQATAQNAAQASGFLGGQKGISNALATRQAAGMLGQLNQQAAGQAGLQQLAAQQGYGHQLSAVGQAYAQMANAANQGTGAAQQLSSAQMGMMGPLIGGGLQAVGSIFGGSAAGGAAAGEGAGSAAAVAALAKGGTVPGVAQSPGDSYANDNVSAKLSPGEIVVPRSAAQDPAKAAEFAHQESMKNQYSDQIMKIAAHLESQGMDKVSAISHAHMQVQKMMARG